jgi:hypothetical protein
MRLIRGNRYQQEAELLKAIWTDPTPRYKTLLKNLYSRKPELFLIKISDDDYSFSVQQENNKK